MAEVSKIQWTDSTFNPWRGCTKVSPGCKFCYAEKMSGRNPDVLGEWGPDGTRVVAAEAYWRGPEKWNKAAESEGRRRRVFCASLADIFEGPDTMPESDGGYSGDAFHYVPTLGNDWIAAARERLFELIINTPHLDWLLCTKRPHNVLPLFGTYLHWTSQLWPKNAWVGISVEDQPRAEQRLRYVTAIRDAGCPVVFVSGEPLLEAIDVSPWMDKTRGVNWLIVGGESGGEARQFDPMWARLLREQCDDKAIPFFFKQLGSNPLLSLKVKGKGGDLDDIPEDLRVRDFPAAA